MKTVSNGSILNSIKSLLGSENEYEGFDTDLIFNINASFAKLQQLGVGPKEGFSIWDDAPKWNDFLEDCPNLNFAKMYVYINSKLVFDPPANSAHIELLKEQRKEYEFRMTVNNDMEEANI